jgi:hypothetical protein
MNDMDKDEIIVIIVSRVVKAIAYIILYSKSDSASYLTSFPIFTSAL